MYSDIQRKERQPEISQLQGWCFSFNICLNVDGQKVGECFSVFMYNAVSILDFFFSLRSIALFVRLQKSQVLFFNFYNVCEV